MSTLDPRTMNLADFYSGHDTDPLAPPPEFLAWVAGTAEEQRLFQTPLAGSAGPRTRLVVDGAERELLNLASLDYLGLNRDPRIAAAIRDALEEWGVGACGVPLLTGTSRLHKTLEERVSAMTGRADTMLFPSGFSGGVGLMSALLRRGDVAIADAKAHMCWMDGIRTSGAQLVMFPHGDLEALDTLLSRHRSARRVVIVDGLYSMDGDVADLPALLDVCDAHGVGLIVDEAHSIFALGAKGGGVTEAAGVQARVRLLFGTFSKGLSMLGGFAASSRELLTYGRLYAHPFGFSAALPPAYVAGMITAVDIAVNEPERRKRLADNAAYFRLALQQMGLDTGRSTTHVVPIILRDRALLYRSGLDLRRHGLYLVPVDYPAVPEDAVRFRTSLSAAHTREDLDTALNLIEHYVARPLRSGS
ncbi:MAG: aminotransferase class I/II-fold pyridoxal phosphate-dependent enzyme [Vicinamibacterales bacterium]